MNPLLGKLVFILALTVLFIVYFGYPSFERYRAQHTLISESKVQFKTKEPPAITIETVIRKDSGTEYSWKGNSEVNFKYDEVIETFCYKSGDMNATIKCIDDKTFRVAEVVEQAMCGDEDLNDPEFWSEDLSYFFLENFLH